MTIHEKIQAWVSEMSTDYLFVVIADGKAAIAGSDIEFAKEAIKDLQEFVENWEKEEEMRNRKHHHDPNRQKPGNITPPGETQ